MEDIHSFEPIWPEWQIDQVLGHGSFNTVYRAVRKDSVTGMIQEAAVKHIAIPSHITMEEVSPKIFQQFCDAQLRDLERELKTMVELRGKPNIMTYEEHRIIPRSGGTGYDAFLRMERLTSLKEYLKTNGSTFPIRDPKGGPSVVKLGMDIARALETLQKRNMVHLDIKPSNIFLDKDGDFKLGDFGVAMVVSDQGNEGMGMTGTPNYMAPEVASRKSIDLTVDIYSLGILLYRLLNNGIIPFVDPKQIDYSDALSRRTKGEPVPAPANGDPGLNSIVLKCLAFKPEDRWQTGGELLEALEHYDKAMPSQAAGAQDAAMPDVHSLEPIWPGGKLGEQLGHGAYGAVYRATRRDSVTGMLQEAAVKRIPIPDPSDDETVGCSIQTLQKMYRQQLGDLQREIEAMIELQGKSNLVSYEEHRIIPRANGLGYDIFLRMELLTSLNDHLRRGRVFPFLDPNGGPSVVKLGIDISHALQIMEKRGMVHRDIKPANVFLDKDGEFKLGDFGTVRELAGTHKTSRIGTYPYMAPEIYIGTKNYDQTVDIYSLGLMLYRFLNNGFLPFMDPQHTDYERAQLIRFRQDMRIPKPSAGDPALQAIVLKCVAYRPGDRWQNATELRKALEAYCEKAAPGQLKQLHFDDPDETVPGKPAATDPPSGKTDRHKKLFQWLRGR